MGGVQLGLSILYLRCTRDINTPMSRRVYRSSEEQIRHFLQRGLELYRKRVRARASQIIREFLGVQRLPRKLTFRDVEAFLEAVFKGRTKVPFMFEWTMRFRGRWLAIKWAWYLRRKTYWRERLEELYKGLMEYKRQLSLLKEGDVYWWLGRLSGCFNSLFEMRTICGHKFLYGQDACFNSLFEMPSTRGLKELGWGGIVFQFSV